MCYSACVRSRLAILIGLLGVIVVRSARAEAPTVRVDPTAASRCANAPERVAELSAEHADSFGGPAKITIDVSEVSGELVATARVEHEGRSTVRELRAKSCDEVVRAAVAVARMSIEAESGLADDDAKGHVERRPAANPRPARDGAKRDTSTQLESPRPPAAAPRSRWLVGVLGASGHFDSATLPGATMGLGLHGGVTLARAWRIEARLAAWDARQTEVASSRSGATFNWQSGALLGCRFWRVGRVGVGPCAGAELDRLHGEAFGVDVAHSKDTILAALVGEARAQWSLSRRFGVCAALGATVPLRRPTFVVRPDGHVHAPAPASFRAVFGPEVSF